MGAPLESTAATTNNNSTVGDSVSAISTVAVSIVDSAELSDEEWRDRLHLERQVERAFYQAGKALTQISTRRLYRSTHKTFEEYCKDRFGFERRYPYRLMEATLVVENIMQMCPNWTQNEIDHDTFVIQPENIQILPTNEGQVRPLVSLEPEQQRTCWQQAVEAAGGKVPSGRIVKDIVDKIRERTKVPNPYCIGEVCQIIPKDNPELKGKSGCWGVIAEVGDYSCALQTWDGEYTAKIENLKSLEYLDVDRQFMQQLCQRMRKLHQVGNIDASVGWLLAGLGKRLQPYLTSLQEKYLTVAEQEYGL